MKTTLSFLVLLLNVALVFGHGWLVSPTPRVTSTTNSNQPCETATPSATKTSVTAGAAFQVGWIHPHSGGTIKISLAPTASATSSSAFTTIKSVPYDSPIVGNQGANSVAGVMVTIDSNTAAGDYTLQWNWDSQGYYNCADLKVVGKAPSGASPTDDPNIYKIPHGTYNIATGKVKCDSSYVVHGKSCKLSGGAVFGILLFVFVLLALFAFIGFVVFLKVKRPEKYTMYKAKIATKLARK